jgi:hypothetical protein
MELRVQPYVLYWWNWHSAYKLLYRREMKLCVQLYWWKLALRVQTTSGRRNSVRNYTGGNRHSAYQLQARLLYRREMELRMRLYGWKLALRVSTTGETTVQAGNGTEDTTIRVEIGTPRAKMGDGTLSATILVEIGTLIKAGDGTKMGTHGVHMKGVLTLPLVSWARREFITVRGQSYVLRLPKY